MHRGLDALCPSAPVSPPAGTGIAPDLVDFLAGLTARDTDEVARLLDILLHHPPRDQHQWIGRSDLNANQSPVQALLAAKPGRWEARLLGDPAFHRGDPIARWQGSLSVLAATLTAAGATSLREMIDLTLATIVPTDEASRRAYPTGMIRIAVPLMSSGIAVYVSPPPQSDRWMVARRWASAVFGDPQPALRIITAVEKSATLFGVGLEGAAPARVRAKIYWRMQDPVPLSSFGIALFERETVRNFMAAVMRRNTFPLRALTFSAGFAPLSGALTDIKIDVCNAGAGWGLSEGLALASHQARALDLVMPPFDPAAIRSAAHRVAIACLGLGLDREGGHRLNIYLQQH